MHASPLGHCCLAGVGRSTGGCDIVWLVASSRENEANLRESFAALPYATYVYVCL